VRVSHLAQTTCIVAITSFITFVGNAWSNVDEPDIETYGYAHINPRNADIFTIDIPGETYDPLSGSVGHTFTDLSAPGNGHLPIRIQRKFQEIPKAYPYAFGNMELAIPYLQIEGQSFGVTETLGDDPNFVCALPNGDPTDSRPYWRSLSFNHEGGKVYFVKKEQLTTAAQANVPSQAFLISANNWILSCATDNPAIFEVRSPDGTLYRLIQRERWVTHRGFGPDPDAPPKFSTYRIYANKVKRHGTTLTYEYERPSDFGLRTHAVYPPIAQGDLVGDNNVIRNKYRIKRIVASNTLGTDSREININYRSGNVECPFLVSSITSPDIPGGNVQYSYTRNQNGTSTTTIDQCLLNTVKYADNSFFHFRYGIPGQPHEFLHGSKLRGNQERITAYFPLLEVTTPTGAAVQYTYISLGTCEYQDSSEDFSNLDYTYSNPTVCGGIEPKRPALVNRKVAHLVAPIASELNTNQFRALVSSPSFPESDQQIEYEKETGSGGETDFSSNRVIRRVRSEKRIHELVFGRIDRFGDPYVINGVEYGDPTVDPNLTGRLTHSGKLLSHRVINRSNDATLSNTAYTYSANMNFLDMDTFHYPRFIHTEPGVTHLNNTIYRYRLLVANWFFDVQRINLINTTVNYNGISTTSKSRSYDSYNYPTRRDSLQGLVSNPDISKTTEINYDHDRNTLTSWNIGLPDYIEVGKSSGGNALDSQGSPSEKTYRSYTPSGLLNTETRHGVTTIHTYYPNGDMESTKVGSDPTTYYKDYDNGISTRTDMPNGGVATRVLNNDGSVRLETDASGNKVNYRYDTAGRVIKSWLGGTETGVTETIYPAWHNQNAANQRMKEIKQAGENTQKVFYDALGRTVHFISLDHSGLGTNSHRLIAYNSMGQVERLSDPSPTPLGSGVQNWPGTVRHYDAFDRLVSTYHSNTPNDETTYCYGPSCNNDNVFNKAGSVTNGYMVRDPSNYVTAYDFRSLGHPSNEELMSVSQVVNATEVVKTQMDRNIHGFITAVRQGAPNDVGSGGSAPERTYTPFKNNGSITPWLKSETHPEFGTRTIEEYDGVGRPKKVRQFDDSFLNYTYHTLGSKKTVKAAEPNSTEVDLATYDYWPNGDIKFIETPDTRLDYTYVPLKPQLLSEKLTIGNETPYRVIYGYDTFNRLDSITYPDDTRVSYGLNGAGLPVSLTLKRDSGDIELVTDVDYFANGRVQSITHGNGHLFQTIQDNRQRPAAWSVSDTGNGLTPFDFVYSYDKRSNVKAIDGYFGATGQDLDGLRYDGLNRLIAANGSWGGASYSYDLQGNILSAIHGDLTQHYTYEQNNDQVLKSISSNQPLSTPQYQMDYDDNGNVIDTSFMVMTYDPLNRMKTLDRNLTDAFSDKSFSYTYDGNNHRAMSSKSVDVSNPTNSFLLTTHHMYSSGGDLLFERDVEAREDRKHIYLAGRTIATIASHQNHDTDNDKIPDYYERLNGLNPLTALDASNDDDQDGLSNLHEYLAGTFTANSDSDHDGLPDKWELDFGLDPTAHADALEDADNDTISNFAEYTNGTNPVDHQMYLVPILYQHAM